MLELGLKLWSTNVGAYRAEAERLYRAGTFAYLELFVVPGSMSCLDAWRSLRDGTGLPFVIHNAHAAAGFNLADAAAEARNREIFAETKAYADALGADRIIFHGGMDGTIEETVRQLKRLAEPRALIENKPLVPLKNPLGYGRCRGATVDELAFALSETGCGFCLDVGHAVCSANAQGREPYGFVAELKERFRPTMYHLSDIFDMSSVYDAHPHLGTGALDLPRVCREILPDGATVSIETVRDDATTLGDFVRDVDWLRQVEKSCGAFGIIGI